MSTTKTEMQIKVVVRTRPTQSFALKNIILDTLENVLYIHTHTYNTYVAC